MVRTLQKGKAPGYRDRIRPDMLLTIEGDRKDSDDERENNNEAALYEVLAALFNQALRLRAVPEDWNVGQIVSIHKKDAREDPGNYRGITLLSVIGKVMTKALVVRLTEVSEEQGWIADEKGGFRPRRRTEDQALTLYRLLEARRLRKKETFVFFLDMRKAYDTVWREDCFKTRGLGVSGNFLELMQFIYSRTSSSALCDGAESRTFPIREGVRQGDPLSCILFNIFVNDIVSDVKACDFKSSTMVNQEMLRILLFADDVAVPCGSVSDLRKVLSIMERHSRRWRWKAHTGKSEILHVRPRGSEATRPQPVQLYGRELKWVDEYEYLGLTFTSDLSWKTHVSKICDKARVQTQKWKKLFRLRLRRRVKLTLYSAMVRSKLEFGCFVWAPNSSLEKKLEAVQMECLRQIVSGAKSISNWAIRFELGVPRLSSRRKVLLLKHWYQLRALGDEGRLSRKAALWRVTTKSKGKTPLGANHFLAVEAFHELGMDREAWHARIMEARNNGSAEKLRAEFDAECTKAMWDMELTECRAQLEGTKALGLLSLKEAYRMDSYLDSNSLGALTKFKLRVDACLGRTYVNNKVVTIGCPMCGANEETAEHFVCDCPKLNAYRSRLRSCEKRPGGCPSGGQPMVKEILKDHPKNQDWENAILSFLKDSWIQRGKAFDEAEPPEPAARALGRVWQPSLHFYFSPRSVRDGTHSTRALSDPSSTADVDGVNGTRAMTE